MKAYAWLYIFAHVQQPDENTVSVIAKMFNMGDRETEDCILKVREELIRRDSTLVDQDPRRTLDRAVFVHLPPYESFATE